MQIKVNQLGVGYEKVEVIKNLNLELQKHKVTSIIGPNGCGKSTFLQTIARILTPNKGQILLDGEDVHKKDTTELAKKLGLLPQTPKAPNQLTVLELVSYGRSPHQKGFGKLNSEDYAIINNAMKLTATEDYYDRRISDLSGGQRQRVWLATALAQNTEILLLDEPTTYLDVAHQLEIMEILDHLNKEKKTTIIMVLHDINHASRFSDDIILLRNGHLIGQGTPAEMITQKNLKEVFGIQGEFITDEEHNYPICYKYNLIKN